MPEKESAPRPNPQKGKDDPVDPSHGGEKEEVRYGPIIDQRPLARFRRAVFPPTQQDKDAQRFLGKFTGAVIILTSIAALCGVLFLIASLLRPVGRSWKNDRLHKKIVQLEEDGYTTEAFDAALKARSSDPNEARWLKLISAIATRGGGNEISPFWERLAELDAMDAESWALWAEGLVEREQYQEAYDRSTSFLEQFPEDPRAHAWAGRSSALLGRHKEAETFFSKAVEGLPDDKELEIARILNALRTPGTLEQDWVNQAESLWELAKREDQIGQIALDSLWTIRTFRQQEAARLAHVTLNHPLATFRRKLEASTIQLILQPNLRTSIIEEAIRLHGGRRGEELADLGKWLNSTGAYEQTIALATEERLSGNALFWEPYLEALLSKEEPFEAEIALRRADCPLSGPHLDIIRAHIAVMKKDDPDVIEKHLKEAAQGALALQKPLLLVEVGRFADQNGFPKIARDSWLDATPYPNGAGDAYENLLMQSQEQGNVSQLALDTASACEDEFLRERFLDRAIYYHLLAGLDLENWVITARERLAEKPNDPRRKVLAAFAELRMGNPALALRTVDGAATGNLTEGERAVAVRILEANQRTAMASKVRSEITTETLLPDEARFLESSATGLSAAPGHEPVKPIVVPPPPGFTP